MSANIGKASIILVCLAALFAQTADLQSTAHSLNQPSRRLYRVYDKDKRPGFIDKSGKLVIGFDRLPANIYVGEFSEGLASICFSDGRGNCRTLGYMDETGKIVIEPRFRFGWDFSEGLAYVQAEGIRGFINRRGEVVIKLKAEVTGGGEFHEGLAVIRPEGVDYVFIDRTGRVVTKEKYTFAERFSEGLAAVAVGLGKYARYGFINQKGEVVIPLQFQPELGHHNTMHFLSRFSDGLAKVKVGKLYGYIDKQGEFVIKPQFLHAADFSEGLASIMMESGETGYIDKSGRLVINLHDAGGESFKEGLAVVVFPSASGGKYGYIDRMGKVVIEARFYRAFDFIDGVAQVWMAESASEIRVGYIDRTGKYIWEPQ